MNQNPSAEPPKTCGDITGGSRILFGLWVFKFAFPRGENASEDGEERAAEGSSPSETGPNRAFPHLQGTAGTPQHGSGHRRGCKSQEDKDKNRSQFSEGSRTQEGSGA